MEFTVSNQPYVFLFSVVSGVLIAFLFDLFRISRRVVNCSKRVVLFQDILFWIIATVVFFISVLLSNSGEIRLFEFVATLLGAILYFFTVSRFVIFTSVKIIELLLKILSLILKILFTPIKWILRILKRPYFIVLGRGKRTFGKMKYALINKWKMCKKFVTKI